MTLTNTDVKQFKRLYKKYFGLTLEEKDARNKLNSLVRQVSRAYKTNFQAQEDKDEYISSVRKAQL